MSASGPATVLGGLRVIDCSTIDAGCRASAVLADYGADVIVVEPPGGDGRRERWPSDFAVFHRGKRSLVLDPTERPEVFADLLRSADILIESHRPGSAPAERFAELHDRHPHLIVLSLTGGGPDGNLAHLEPYESLVHAAVGTMAEQLGHRDGPIYEAIPFASIGAAHLGVIGALAALHRRADDGIGRHVETSLLDGVLAYMSMYWGESDALPSGTSSTAARATGATVTTRLASGAFRCGDGEYLGVSTAGVGAFGRLMVVLGLDDRIPPTEEKREMSIPLLPHEKVLIHDELHRLFAREPRDVWTKRLVAADICAIPQMRAGEIFDDEQARANSMVQRVTDPVLGDVEQVGRPIRFDAVDEAPWRGAPRHGEHTDEILAELRSPRDRYLCGSQPSRDEPVLAGVVILDLGAYAAGPYSSRLLADLGASVIKVEPPQGDPLRAIPRMFRAAQTGKASVAIDLRDPAMQSVLDRLIERADIVHHNMRPRVADELHLDAARVRASSERAIFGVASAWSSTGPNANRQSLEPMMSGYVGAAFEVAGQFNDPLYPICNSDMGNGLIGAMAMVMALVHRRRTGRALSYENAHLNASMVHVAHIVRTRAGELAGAARLDAMQYGFGSFDRLYETRDGWVCIAASEPAEVESLLTLLGPDAAAVREVDYELGQLIAAVASSRTTREWLTELRGAGVPAVAPVGYNNAGFMRDPENRRTGRVVEVPSVGEGMVRQVGHLVRISHSAVAPIRIAPELGADTAAVLRSVGHADAEIASLVERRVARVPAAVEGTSGPAR